MRRPSTVELMLLTTVLLWALNLSVTKYIPENGFLPLPYASIRYGLAGAIFMALTLYAERTLRVERRHLPILGLAALTLYLNQLSFVFALDLTTASTIGLVLGAIPIFAALFGLALGTERPTPRFWVAALVSFVGVALVALGSGGETTASLWGMLLVLSTLGPLVLTNVLWFRSIHRIGANRATLAANLQPFVAAVLAVILLSEPLDWLQVAGGVLIALGILAVRRRA